MRELLNIAEFAEAVGLTPAGARRWLLERRIETVRIGRLVKIPRAEVARLIEQGTRPARRNRP
jgi:excisionase family DNA binding protein